VSQELRHRFDLSKRAMKTRALMGLSHIGNEKIDADIDPQLEFALSQNFAEFLSAAHSKFGGIDGHVRMEVDDDDDYVRRTLVYTPA
jgi:hypothetical protein